MNSTQATLSLGSPKHYALKREREVRNQKKFFQKIVKADMFIKQETLGSYFYTITKIALDKLFLQLMGLLA